MRNENAAPSPRSDDEYAWMRDGSVPHSREDLVAEVLALLALVFSLGIGLVIALLPVSAKASTVSQPAAASRLLPDLRIEYPMPYLDRTPDGAGKREVRRHAAVTASAAGRARATIACASDA